MTNADFDHVATVSVYPDGIPLEDMPIRFDADNGLVTRWEAYVFGAWRTASQWRAFVQPEHMKEIHVAAQAELDKLTEEELV